MSRGSSLAALLVVSPGIALAAPLLPGSVATFLDDPAYSGVSLSDPGFTGPVIGSYSRTATRTQDGFDEFSGEVIEDLWVVEATLAGDVIRLDDTGTVAFTTTPTVDLPSAGSDRGLFGLMDYTLTGFAGYAVDIDSLDALFRGGVEISRSPDGDTITFDYNMGIPGDSWVLAGPGGSYVLRTDAPAFRLDAVSEVELAIPTFGSETQALSGVAAPAPIPLPAGWALLGGALGLCAGLRRRRARAQTP